jgi:hypothetical protein
LLLIAILFIIIILVISIVSGGLVKRIIVVVLVDVDVDVDVDVGGGGDIVVLLMLFGSGCDSVLFRLILFATHDRIYVHVMSEIHRYSSALSISLYHVA